MSASPDPLSGSLVGTPSQERHGSFNGTRLTEMLVERAAGEAPMVVRDAPRIYLASKAQAGDILSSRSWGHFRIAVACRGSPQLPCALRAIAR
jgi:hypothetical protein